MSQRSALKFLDRDLDHSKKFLKWPGVRFSKAPKRFGPISGTIIHYVSWKQTSLNMELNYTSNISYLKDTLK